MAALVGAHAAEKEQVLAALGMHRVGVQVEGVVAVGHPREIGLRLALVEGHRDEPDLRSDTRQGGVEVAVRAHHRPVHGVDDRGVDGRAERSGQRAGVVVDDVELVGPLVAGQRVAELRCRLADVR